MKYARQLCSVCLLLAVPRFAAAQRQDADILYPICRNGQWGYIDRAGNVVGNHDYDAAGPFQGGVGIALKGRETLVIDPDGKERPLPICSPYRDGRAFIYHGEGGGRFAVVDETGKVVRAGIHAFLPYADGLAAVSVTTNWMVRWVYIDRAGRTVLDTRDTPHSATGQTAVVAGGDERWATAWPFVRGRSRVFLAHRHWGYIDRTGAIAIAGRYERAYDFTPEGLARVREDGLWGFIDVAGEYVVPPRYEDARDFSDGVAAVRVGAAWGYIDASGTMAIEPAFDEPRPFREGLLIVKRDGKAGFMDKTGHMVIPASFDDLRPFHGALAEAWVGTQWGYIDRTGHFVCGEDTLFATP